MQIEDASQSGSQIRYWSPRRARIRTLLAIATVVAAATSLLASPASASDNAALKCSRHTLQVRIADPGPADQTLTGDLCYRGPREPATVQLLVHGGTYNHAYWDFPYGNGYYSYARAATLAGYATFNVDRIGTGASSHPAGEALNTEAGAIALHDAISALRSGAVDGHAFHRVVWVGHSFGTTHAWVEIARYHDVDAAVLTGALHYVNADVLGGLVGSFYPAALDPMFADAGLDPEYMTTVPGTRGSLFYDQRTVDPGVLATDEATKDVVPMSATNNPFAVVALPPAAAPSNEITVPVLLVDGVTDNVFCAETAPYDCAKPATVRAFESQYYSRAAKLDVVTIPRTGHDVALSTTAPIADAAMLAWSLSVVAP